MPREEVLTPEDLGHEMGGKRHPYCIVAKRSTGNKDVTGKHFTFDTNETFADDLGGALLAAKTMAEEEPVDGDGLYQIVITMQPGWRMLQGDPFYSDAWL